MKLELEQNEIETIINVLGQAPYAQVAGIISKISQQVKPQLNKK